MLFLITKDHLKHTVLSIIWVFEKKKQVVYFQKNHLDSSNNNHFQKEKKEKRICTKVISPVL